MFIQKIFNVSKDLRQKLFLGVNQAYKSTKEQKDMKIRYRTCTPIYPPPGLNLQLPEWTPEEFLTKIGGNCDQIADKFETLPEIFDSNKFQMKEKGIPPPQRKHIKRIVEQMRRGVLTFDYLKRRTAVKVENK